MILKKILVADDDASGKSQLEKAEIAVAEPDHKYRNPRIKNILTDERPQT